jgi:hypothetical protein
MDVTLTHRAATESRPAQRAFASKFLRRHGMCPSGNNREDSNSNCFAGRKTNKPLIIIYRNGRTEQ